MELEGGRAKLETWKLALGLNSACQGRRSSVSYSSDLGKGASTSLETILSHRHYLIPPACKQHTHWYLHYDPQTLILAYENHLTTAEEDILGHQRVSALESEVIMLMKI